MFSINDTFITMVVEIAEPEKKYRRYRGGDFTEFFAHLGTEYLNSGYAQQQRGSVPLGSVRVVP